MILLSCVFDSIIPYKTSNSSYFTISHYTRENTRLLSCDSNHRSNYGGTSNDDSLIRYIDLLRKNNYKIMFYPMIFMDMPGKPWRGHLIAKDAKDIKYFFNKKKGYNEFILHYAKLIKGKVDAFVIGSELVSITQTIDDRYDFHDARRYPAVIELIDLARQVKEILGPDVVITYAANWSEYHHDPYGFPHLDSLWSSEYIDVIGIDAYLPVTDRMKGEISIEDIKKGWRSGELWDYVYDGAKTVPVSPEWGMKNIEFWWNNEHHFRGMKTSWKPKMKPIWFTEFGFPSIHMATNQPSVYYDPNKARGSSPKHSKSNPDFVLQMRAIRATLEYWQERTDIVQNMFLWAWDVRPFPYYPSRIDLYSDGRSWSRGHWINGKIEPLEQVTLLSNFDVGDLKINAKELVINGLNTKRNTSITAHNIAINDNISSEGDLSIKANSIVFGKPVDINVKGTLLIDLTPTSS